MWMKRMGLIALATGITLPFWGFGHGLAGLSSLIAGGQVTKSNSTASSDNNSLVQALAVLQGELSKVEVQNQLAQSQLKTLKGHWNQQEKNWNAKTSQLSRSLQVANAQNSSLRTDVAKWESVASRPQVQTTTKSSGGSGDGDGGSGD